MNKPKRIRKYGAWVWRNEQTDILRGNECLCLHCGLMNNGCMVAGDLYEICKEEDLALMITRCPNWEGK